MDKRKKESKKLVAVRSLHLISKQLPSDFLKQKTKVAKVPEEKD